MGALPRTRFRWLAAVIPAAERGGGPPLAGLLVKGYALVLPLCLEQQLGARCVFDSKTVRVVAVLAFTIRRTKSEG